MGHRNIYMSLDFHINGSSWFSELELILAEGTMHQIQTNVNT